MNKRFLAMIALGLGILGGIAFYKSCSKMTIEERGISHYTCPMHPHVHADKPGSCPICQMKLVPVFKESDQSDKSDRSDSLLISPDRQQIIGLKTTPALRKEVSQEIVAPGRVAFDPKLATAQAEFVEIARGVPSLKEAAVQRLTLMGMTKEEIRLLERRGKPDQALLLPQENGPVWVYAPIYSEEISSVQVGMKGSVIAGQKSFEGVIKGIEPVLDPMTRSARARIEIPGAGGRITPETYVTVKILVPLGEQLVIPQSAVIETGTRNVVFIVHEGQHFSAREVKLGPQAQGDRVILEGLKEGEVVATSAAFLIDSESQLKAAVSGMGGHQH